MNILLPTVTLVAVFMAFNANATYTEEPPTECAKCEPEPEPTPEPEPEPTPTPTPQPQLPIGGKSDRDPAPKPRVKPQVMCQWLDQGKMKSTFVVVGTTTPCPLQP